MTHEQIRPRTYQVSFKLIGLEAIKPQSLEELRRLDADGDKMLYDCLSGKEVPRVEVSVDSFRNA